MAQAQNVQHTSPSTTHRSPHRRAVTRLVAATAVVVASLSVAAPSWAGPLTGC